MKRSFLKIILFGALSTLHFSLCAGVSSGKLVEPLDTVLWNTSQWISVEDAPVVTGKINDGSRAADGASWFVAPIRNKGKVISAKWMTSGLGTYDLYVNGKLIGNEVLKPGFTHPYRTKRSFTYDVIDAFICESNALNIVSAEVTPGWWADKIVTPAGHDGMVGKKCAFRGVLQLTYSDGSTQIFPTNTSDWKAGIAGKVKHAAIFDGEVFDNREKPGYECYANMKAPVTNEEFQGEVLPTNGAEIYLREDLTLQPVESYVWQGVSDSSENEQGKVIITRQLGAWQPVTLLPGETLVVDFGQNSSGVPHFEFSANEGTTLKCEFAELLNDGNGAKKRGMDGPEGSVHRLNLRIPNLGMQLEYTFSGEETEHYSPRHTFFGYRYASITASDTVTINTLTSTPVTSITQQMETGKITTGNNLINQLISNTRWGMISNYLSVPTDCPQRNERLGWTADTQVFAATGSYFAYTAQFFHKWMRDMRDSQHHLGGFPGVAPLGQYGDDMMRLGWADAGIIVPWTMWKQFGDVALVEDCWESMMKFINRVNETKYDHEAIKEENRNYQWADWLSYEPLESCSGRGFNSGSPLPESIEYWNFLGASYWAIDAAMMRDMAQATGRLQLAEQFEKMNNEAKDYLKSQFLNQNGTFKVDLLNTMQTPAIFALQNGLVEGDAKAKMLSRLRQNFKDHDGCLQTGFLGTSLLMSVLTENGMSDVAYDLLFQRKNPSWLYSIDNGATTIWERWNSYMIEHGMGPKGMNSFNHYAYGCVCQWLWETAAGISADKSSPGFKNIIMKPIPDKRLGSVAAEYASAAGLIKSAWEYKGDNWIWNFTIPEGSTATVTLPGQSESAQYAAGSHTVTLSLK